MLQSFNIGSVFNFNIKILILIPLLFRFYDLKFKCHSLEKKKREGNKKGYPL